MTIEYVRTWLQDGRLFISSGYIDDESGRRHIIQGGEVRLRDGYLFLEGPVTPSYDGPERRHGAERRQWHVLNLLKGAKDEGAD